MHRPLPLRFKYLIVFLRYGSLTKFDKVYMKIPDIARATNCHYSTVYMYLARHRERGYRVLPLQYHKRGRTPWKIKGELRKFLLSDETLRSWVGYTLL